MEHRANVSSIEKTICASLGALATSLVVTPLDVIKTRLQMQEPIHMLPKSLCCHNFAYCGGDIEFAMCPQIQELLIQVPKRPLVLHGTWVSMWDTSFI
jgi:hypothetical protein